MAVTTSKEYRLKRITAWKIDLSDIAAIVAWCGATEYDEAVPSLVVGDVNGGAGDQVIQFADGHFEIWTDEELDAHYELVANEPA